MSLLEAVELSRHFGGFAAVDSVSLAIEQNQLTALIGPNGAGKTTLYNLLSGRLTPTHGRVLFDGREVTGLPPHTLVQRGMARSFQITNVFADLTALENVLVGLTAKHGKGLSMFRRVRADAALRSEGMERLERLGLATHAHAPCRTLSYGNKRLLELAIALSSEPKLVLLDEPAAGMTPEETARIVELIGGLAAEGQYSFVLTEHDMDVVFGLAERIVVLHQGRLLADGTPDAIRSNPEVRSAYLGATVPA